jgi:ribosomal-protein-alanine N-acetyltransferase
MDPNLPAGQTCIRAATEQDLPQILQLEELSFEKHWDYYNFKASLHDIFLVYDDQGIVGFLVACCCRLSQRGMILKIAVHPEHRSKGIATELIRTCLAELKRRDLVDVELDVDIVKEGAVRLYEKVGFSVVEAISISYEDDDTFYIMRRKLD